MALERLSVKSKFNCFKIVKIEKVSGSITTGGSELTDAATKW